MARGTVRKRSRGSWEIRWDGPRGEDGKRKQCSKTVRGTKKAAEAELNRIEADLNKSDAERASEIPVAVCCELFLKERSGTDLRPSSVAVYEWFFKNFVIPVCGEVPLGKVDRNMLQRIIQRMIDHGLASNTIHTRYGSISALFSWAVRAGLLRESPLKGLTLPERSHESVGQVLSSQEVCSLLGAFEDTAFWLPMFLGLHTGMRPGEVLGLGWDEVDLDGGAVFVSRTLSVGVKGFGLGPPKTKSSKRSVAVSAEVVEVLRERERNRPETFWVWQYSEKGEGGERRVAVPVEFSQVCAMPDGRIINNQLWNRVLRSTLGRLALRKVRAHDLRHTHASLLLLDNVPMHVVSKRLGHADIQTTVNLYGHLLPSSDPEAASRFADLVRVVP